MQMYAAISGPARHLVVVPPYYTRMASLRTCDVGQGAGKWSSFQVRPDWESGNYAATYAALVASVAAAVAEGGAINHQTGLTAGSSEYCHLDLELHPPHDTLLGVDGWGDLNTQTWGGVGDDPVYNEAAEASFIAALDACVEVIPGSSFGMHYVPIMRGFTTKPADVAGLDAVALTADDAKLQNILAACGHIGAVARVSRLVDDAAIGEIAPNGSPYIGYDEQVLWFRYCFRRAILYRDTYGGPGQPIIGRVWWESIGGSQPKFSLDDLEAAYEAAVAEDIDGLAVACRANDAGGAEAVQQHVDAAWWLSAYAGVDIPLLLPGSGVSPASPGGDTVQNPSGGAAVRIHNGGGSPIDVTIRLPVPTRRPADAFWPAMTLGDIVVTVPAGASRAVGPVPRLYNTVKGEVLLEYSDATGVTVEALA